MWTADSSPEWGKAGIHRVKIGAFRFFPLLLLWHRSLGAEKQQYQLVIVTLFPPPLGGRYREIPERQGLLVVLQLSDEVGTVGSDKVEKEGKSNPDHKRRGFLL